jgi:hypothetical protein
VKSAWQLSTAASPVSSTCQGEKMTAWCQAQNLFLKENYLTSVKNLLRMANQLQQKANPQKTNSMIFLSRAKKIFVLL